MPDAILITGCPALLESRGPNHEPPVVFQRRDGTWTDEEPETFMEKASPLWHEGSPVWPAIDAARRATGIGADHAFDDVGRDLVLFYAKMWASKLGATLINLEPINAPNA